MVVLVLLVALVVTSCQPGTKNRFPALTTAATTASSSATKPTDAPSSSTPITLRVAGPFTAEAAEALRQLYLNLESGQLKRTDGTTIGDRFKPGGAIPDDASLTIRFEPITLGQMMDGNTYRAMAAAGTLPDVFATGDVGSLVKLKAVADLTSIFKSIDTQSASRIPIFAFEALQREGKYWGIPYLATVPVLLVNRGLASQLDLKLPEGRMTAAGLSDVLIQASGKLQELSRPIASPTAGPTAKPATSPAASPTPVQTTVSNPYTSVSAIADLRPFLKYWPTSMNPSLGFAAYQNGRFNFDSGSVSETLTMLRGLDRNQMTPALSQSKAGAIDQTAARTAFRNNQTVFLVEDSGALPEWSLQSHVQVGALDLPTRPGSLGDSKTAPERQAFKVSAYCVSATSAYPMTAARVAMFLAQDPDALLLQNQYVTYEGYVPLSHDAAVWDRLVSRQTSNTVLSGNALLQTCFERLHRGYADPSVLIPGFNKALSETLLSPNLFLPDISLQPAAMTSLNEQAATLLKEGS